MAQGLCFFNAPAAIIVSTDKSLEPAHSYTDVGILMQTICLTALSHGLGTCIMGRPVDWPNNLREMLGVPQSKAMICGIIIGYPDTEDRANNVPRIRMPLEEWVSWHGF